MSVQEVILRAGYSIEDQDVFAFLSEFAALNDHIKSLSRIRKGSVVKLPLAFLHKGRSPVFLEKEKSELQTVKKRIIEKRKAVEIEQEFNLRNRSLIIKNITALSEALDHRVTFDADGFKIFSLSESSEIALDARRFLMINVSSGNTVVLDYDGVLPSEIKDLIEINWPEYKIVVNRAGLDLRHIVGLLLDSMGYAYSRDSKVIFGAKTQVEYNADFSIYQKKNDIFDSSILIIGIIGPRGLATPENVLAWLRGKGLHIIELTYSDSKQYADTGARVLQLEKQGGSREFTEALVSALGYKVLKGMRYNLSDRKEYQYTLRADLSIPWGNKPKIIEFSELSEQEVNYARQRGFDIASIRSWEEKRDIADKILSLLSLNRISSPQANASVITPKGVKYRLLSPGSFVHSNTGQLFVTGSDFDPDILGGLMGKEITLITF